MKRKASNNSSSSSSSTGSPALENPQLKKPRYDRDWTFHHYDFETKQNACLQSVTIEKTSTPQQEESKQKILRRWNVEKPTKEISQTPSSSSSSAIFLEDNTTSDTTPDFSAIHPNSTPIQIPLQLDCTPTSSLPGLMDVSTQEQLSDTNLLHALNELLCKNQELEQRVGILQTQLNEKDQLIKFLLQTMPNVYKDE